MLPGVTTNTSVQCHVTYPETADYTLGGSLTSESVEIVVNDITVHPANRTVVIGEFVVIGGLLIGLLLQTVFILLLFGDAGASRSFNVTNP